jgi:hypothetical protein
MAFVTMVKYSVKFNRTLLEAFSPTRGLRKDTPCLPFYSYLSRMTYQLYCSMRLRQAVFPPSKFVAMLRGLHTCCLRMILCYSLEPRQIKLLERRMCWIYMRKVRPGQLINRLSVLLYLVLFSHRRLKMNTGHFEYCSTNFQR